MQAIGQVRRYHRAFWGIFLALLIAGLLSIHLATAVSADVSVNIMNFKFDPTPLTIPVGTTVVWTNQDSAPHTATSDPGSAFTFTTKLLQKGQSDSVTFTMVGTFTYYCTVHPNMHATVVVTAAGASAPVAPAAPSASAPSTTAPTTAAPPAGNPPAVTGPVGSGSGNSTNSTTSTSSSAPTTSTGGPSGGLPAYFVRRLGDG